MTRRPAKSSPAPTTDEVTFLRDRQVKDHLGNVVAEYEKDGTYALPIKSCEHFIRLGDAEAADQKGKQQSEPLVKQEAPGPTAQTPEVSDDETPPKEPEPGAPSKPEGADRPKPRPQGRRAAGRDGDGSN